MSKKASRQQYIQLLNEVESSEVLKWGKGTPDLKRQSWDQAAKAINSIGGTQKTGEQWKKV